MAAIVGIDAKVELSKDDGVTWTEMPERNNFQISIQVDTAEHKTFKPSLAEAWKDSARTWMGWSGSMSGYYDDADTSIFDNVVEGSVVKLRFYTSRNSPGKRWAGTAVLTSINHSTGTDDFATLDLDFTGNGPLVQEPVA